jgi:chromosome segregation ATPase
MSLSKVDIVERQKTIVSDAETVQKRIVELTKALEESKNLLQALNGAMQQCNEFLKSFEEENNEKGDAGNGKKKPD